MDVLDVHGAKRLWAKPHGAKCLVQETSMGRTVNGANSPQTLLIGLYTILGPTHLLPSKVIIRKAMTVYILLVTVSTLQLAIPNYSACMFCCRCSVLQYCSCNGMDYSSFCAKATFRKI